MICNHLCGRTDRVCGRTLGQTGLSSGYVVCFLLEAGEIGLDHLCGRTDGVCGRTLGSGVNGSSRDTLNVIGAHIVEKQGLSLGTLQSLQMGGPIVGKQ
ncbi:hypothetical protein LXL04_016851 [Taraxacum kok-saghyz]